MNIKCFKPALFVLSFNLLQITNAQSSYRFEATTAGYAELSQDKRISFAIMDTLSGFYFLKELNGEVFKWYNELFKIDTIKTFLIQPYANLRFDNDSSLIIIDGAFTYLDSIDAASSISYKIEGNSGNKIIKAQWKNLKIRVGQASNFVNIQIWVYQRSGVYEIHYGPSSSNNQNGFNISNGPQVGIFYSSDNFSKCYEKLWITGSPSAYNLDSFANYSFKAMSGVPPNGVVFRFIPKFKTLGMPPVKYNKEVYLYPNPVTTGVLYFSEPGDYHIFDVYGREILYVVNSTEADVCGMPDGIYSIFSNLINPLKVIIQNN